MRTRSETPQNGTDEPFRCRAESGCEGNQFLDRDASLTVLASLHGHQVPIKAFSEGFLCEAGALPELEQGLSDGAMFALECPCNPTGHDARVSEAAHRHNKMW